MKPNYLQAIILVQLLIGCKLPSTCATDFLRSAEISSEMVNKIEHEIVQESRGFLLGWLFGTMFGNVKLQVPHANESNITDFIQWVNDEFSTLKSSPSINEAVQLYSKNVQLPAKETLPEILKTKNYLLNDIPEHSETRRNLMAKVSTAITRTLNFYETHIDEIQRPDSVVALTILKEIDNVHGGNFQKTFPLNKWIENICKTVSLVSTLGEDSCTTISRQLKIRAGRKSKQGYWKAASILEKLLNQTDVMELKNVGEEKEEFWGQLLGQCQGALLTRCEIPYVCERTLLDPIPRSQYHLTHQLLHRVFIDNMDCPSNPSIKSLTKNEQMYTNLCSKIYLETKYLDVLDVQPIHRDLFSEMIGLCGYMGYTNFLREDWLNRILSWQSKSESGCFFKSPQYPGDVLSSDIGFYRKATKVEVGQGYQPKEKCQPHFTATSLLALSVYYDYLMDTTNY